MAATSLLAVVIIRRLVLVALLRAAAWEDGCRSRLRDRQWAEAEARWSSDV